jgi:hypothetical protein
VHKTVYDELVTWSVGVPAGLTVADLGGHNFNGSVKEIFRQAVSFDIKAHASVDVVIWPGVIPPEHKNIYGVVTAMNCLEYCKNTRDFVEEVLGLIARRGMFFMTSCSYGCPYTHGLDPLHATWYKQYRKVGVKEVVDLMGPYFDYYVKDVKTDIVFYGRLR